MGHGARRDGGAGAVTRRGEPGAGAGAVEGLIFDPNGRPMSPSHTRQRG
jgi:hypothetical protein